MALRAPPDTNPYTEGSGVMPRIRKDRAGSDSFGNTWTEDGAVVDVELEQAAALLAIPDGGFSEITPAADEDEAPTGKKELSEVDPDAPGGEPEQKAPAKKAAARKTAARKVEE